MSVQLIVFPQYPESSSSLSSSSNQFFVDGINFNQVNGSSSTQSISGALPQTFINSNTSGSSSLFALNTWYRFSSTALEVIFNSGFLGIYPDTGILQRLSNLVVGATYDLTFDISLITTSGINVYQYTGNTLQSFHTLTNPAGVPVTQTIQFQAYSTSDIIVIYTEDPYVALFNSISCVLSTSTPSGVFTYLSDGQVICDLYEDEDIPLSLSVDDFKNVAEKVQSYSKAFNLPATKRNNQIFDNIFEITRTDTGLNFNPYKRTKCILKQDGFLLFEGYLRMLDISDKSGETSYNVNLYSDVVALADVLGDKTFSDLGFTELEHEYNKTNIQRSWRDAGGGTSITYTNPDTSGFRDDYTTLRYPFVDWTHEILVGGISGTGATSGNPEYTALEQIFRPFINIKYLIDRIFQVVPFTYESTFFDTDDFKKLYMDFNWGADNAPVYSNTTSNGRYIAGSSPLNYGNNTALFLNSWAFAGASNVDYNTTTNRIECASDTTEYSISYSYQIRAILAGSGITYTAKWLLTRASGVTEEIDLLPNQSIAANSYQFWSGSFSRILNNGDTLQALFEGNSSNVVYQQYDTTSTPAVNATSSVIINKTQLTVTSSSLLQTLRGELGQWDFLKGLMTMFNLVTMPDEDNPSNIKIEPYSDVFLNNPNSVELDWTDKIDVSEMKLMPLTDLNKKTIFKFVEDEDDFAFMNYKRQAGGHLYGSKKYDASEFTILAGEDEIIAEPFAATVVKPLEDMWPDIITPALYAKNDDETSEGFDNSPRIMYNNGIKSTSYDYYIPAQNGLASGTLEEYLQFSHLSTIPTATGTLDFHFGECQLIQPVGAPVNDNLFNLYWLPYYSELYNPDTRIMTIKVNLSPSDINTFKFNDTVFIKNRTFRVNKIDYKPNDLATVEFILIP